MTFVLVFTYHAKQKNKNFEKKNQVQGFENRCFQETQLQFGNKFNV